MTAIVEIPATLADLGLRLAATARGTDRPRRVPRLRLFRPPAGALAAALIREPFYFVAAAIASGLFRATCLAMPMARTLRRLGPGAAPPVVLVHGYAGDETNFLALERRLSAAGRRARFARSVLDFTRPIEDLARAARDAIHTVLRATGAPRVDIVAHSMGGLATRYALHRLGARDLVRRVVTLATPHRGTIVARLGVGAPRRQCEPLSEFMAGLEGDLATLPEGMLLSIASDGDLLVPPPSARVPPPQRNLLVPALGHVGVLFSPEVARAAIAFLAV